MQNPKEEPRNTQEEKYEGFITVQAAASFLSIPTNTCYKLCLSGIIPSYKTGKFRRLKLSEVSAYMEAGRVT